MTKEDSGVNPASNTDQTAANAGHAQPQPPLEKQQLDDQKFNIINYRLSRPELHRGACLFWLSTSKLALIIPILSIVPLLYFLRSDIDDKFILAWGVISLFLVLFELALLYGFRKQAESSWADRELTLRYNRYEVYFENWEPFYWSDCKIKSNDQFWLLVLSRTQYFILPKAQTADDLLQFGK